nr:MAG TPA: hypothetical protein [Caudoviricetes sp.]
MWIVYMDKKVIDPQYGTHTVGVKQHEGSWEDCKKYVAEHPGTYIAWYCY